jgi:hypothetical protein
VASLENAVVVRVDVEHLPGWRYRLWLGEPYQRTDLGVVDRTDQLWPEAQRRVGEHLGLPAGGYYADLVVPRPEQVRNGDRVTVRTDGGRQLGATVIGWVQGGVLVDADEEGGGIYAPEDVTFPAGSTWPPGELT